jgi:hypothetical protein
MLGRTLLTAEARISTDQLISLRQKVRGNSLFHSPGLMAEPISDRAMATG